MPFYELLYHLRLNSDGVLYRAGGRLRTKRGLVYIESREGYEFFNGSYRHKTIWCRDT